MHRDLARLYAEQEQFARFHDITFQLTAKRESLSAHMGVVLIRSPVRIMCVCACVCGVVIPFFSLLIDLFLGMLRMAWMCVCGRACVCVCV